MNLQTFVSGALNQIFSGIKDANENSKNKPFKLQKSIGEKRSTIEFDVALTVSEGASKEMGGSLKVLGVEIGGNKDNASSKESISRIKFSVEVDKVGSEEEVDFDDKTGKKRAANRRPPSSVEIY